MDEFALCWNNFRDNIASGFQNLFDRGDLCDVTLAVSGGILHAHKIVLAICSPYFQEIFLTNQCQHPIIILKDVTFSIMTELLQFMYQGEVNVKHTELQTFMKIAESLQIKGLTTSQKTMSPPPHAPHEGAGNFVGTPTSAANNNNSNHHNNNNTAAGHHHRHEAMGPHEAKPNNHVNDEKPPVYPPPAGNAAGPPLTSSRSETASQPQPSSSGGAPKRAHDYSNNPESYGVPYMRKQSKRSAAEQLNDHEISADSIDQMATDEVFLPPIPHISMTPGGEPRFDLTAVKRENIDMPNSPNSFARAHSLATSLGFDYSTAGNSSSSSAAGKPTVEYPNDLHSTNDFSKGMPPHMDIPPVAPGEKWFQGKLEFMLSQRGKPLLVHDGHSFGIQYVRKDKKYWQCNLSRKYNCKARVTTTDMGEIIVTNNEHCHTEIRQHLRKDYRHLKIHQNFAMQQRHFFFNPNAAAAAAVAAGKVEPMFLNAAPKLEPPVYQNHNNNNSSVASNNGQTTPSNESTSGGGSPRNNDGEQD